MSFTQKISNELTLRALANQSDKERWAAFNALNAPSEGVVCACLVNHHPEMTPDDFWIVEDNATHEFVSSTCLIPWRAAFGGVDLRIAQLEMVFTLPQYRGRGLVRTQIQHFEQVVQERGFDLSVISGIPYYYRQYGYAYALEGSTFESLPVWNIPDPSLNGADASIRLRPAGLADIPYLKEIYDRVQRVHAGQDFSVQRNAAYWRYLLEATHRPFQVLEKNPTGEPLGYALITRSAQTVTIQDHGIAAAPAALALLQLLKTQVSGQVQVSWPENSALTVLARQLGSQTVHNGQWLVNIPDMARLLKKLSPVFEQRLAASAWQDLTTEITINLYREAFRLHFKQGNLTRVEAAGFVDYSMGADGGDLCIPPDAFVRLLFGYRALDELFDAWPDIVVKPGSRPLIMTLFPRLQPYLYLPYHDFAAYLA